MCDYISIDARSAPIHAHRLQPHFFPAFRLLDALHHVVIQYDVAKGATTPLMEHVLCEDFLVKHLLWDLRPVAIS